MWECRGCAGLWVGRDAVQRLIAERLRPDALLGTGLPRPRPEPVAVAPVQYGACPDCGKIMNRVNFGRTSGIIVDVCGTHGTWFDADELRRVVEFVAAGGLEAARARELADAREAAPRPTPVQGTLLAERGSAGRPDGEGVVLRMLLSYVRSRVWRAR
jgi:Zn-finger nucleic acid-binding protein